MLKANDAALATSVLDRLEAMGQDGRDFLPSVGRASTFTAHDTQQARRAYKLLASRHGDQDQGSMAQAGAGLLRLDHLDLFSAQLQGLAVTQVVEGSQAARAGMVPGQILLRYQGVSLSQPQEFIQAVEACSSDPTCAAPTLEVLGSGGVTELVLTPGDVGLQTSSY